MPIGSSPLLPANLSDYLLEQTERDKSRLFWRDDMENYTTVKWTPNADTAVTYSQAVGAFEGSYNLKAVAAAALTANFYKYFGKFPSTKVGFEIRWCTPDSFSYIKFHLYHFTGSLKYIAQTEYHEYSPYGWYYLNSSNVSTAIEALASRTSGPGDGTANVWHYFKMIVDLEALTYHKLMVTDSAIATGTDLSDYPLYNTADTTGQSTQIGVTFVTTAVNKPAYFDDARIYFFEE